MTTMREFFGFDQEVNSKIEVFQSDKNGEWYFRVVARNHKTVAQSEGYTRKADCFRGIEALKRAVEISEVVDLTAS